MMRLTDLVHGPYEVYSQILNNYTNKSQTATMWINAMKGKVRGFTC